MPTWELKAFGTDSRYADDVRYRAFTTSAVKAAQFEKINRINFTDSGHGIVFVARELKHGDRRKKAYSPYGGSIAEHVEKELRRIRAEEKLPAEVQALITAARRFIHHGGKPFDDLLTNPSRSINGDEYDRLYAAVKELG